MSNYREDTLETLVVSDKVFLNLKSHVDETLTITEQITFRLTELKTENLVLSDDVSDLHYGYVVIEELKLSDETTSTRTSHIKLTENIKFVDSVFSHNQESIIETIEFSDSDISQIGSMITESLQLIDSEQGQRVIALNVTESIKFSDSSHSFQFENIEEQVAFDDEVTGRAHLYDRLEELLLAQDYDLASSLSSHHIIETLNFKDSYVDTLQAITFETDTLVLSDDVSGNQLYGQAWTANTDTWSMSRYMPFSFEGITTINGKFYAWNDDGVYILGVEGEDIEARITTGKIDFSDNLIHPTAAYLEYELSGEHKKIDMSVTTTQTGQPKQYNYVMPTEQADYLTNGRIIFGRGLRGRHFSFDLNMHGSCAYINSLSIEYAQTARRI